MPKVMPKKHVPLIDMTAMVDVAFLLLTFFILATSFKSPDAAEVRTPSSVTDSIAPGQRAMNITMDSTGRTFVGYSDIATRDKVLDLIIKEYKWEVSEDGRSYFRLQGDYGMSFAAYGQILSKSESEIKEATKKLTGIPYPYVNKENEDNELKRWIVFGTNADGEISKNVSFKGDQNSPVEAVGDVFATLQDWNINRFNLITEKEEAPADMLSKAPKGEEKAATPNENKPK